MKSTLRLLFLAVLCTAIVPQFASAKDNDKDHGSHHNAPEPGTLLMLSSGLMGLGYVKNRISAKR
jgi:hypothetical protein